MNRFQLNYGERSFEYQLFFISDVTKKNNANTKGSVHIHVHPNGLVAVDAPEKASPSDVKKALRKRARWVLKHLDDIHARQAQVLPREYVSGETLFYMGKRYQLKIRSSSGKKSENALPEVRLYRGKIEVIGHQMDSDKIKKALGNWYRFRAEQVFARRLDYVTSHLIWLDTIPEWKLLTMKKQWGSCSPKGVLSLNPRLVKAPVQCIDYVLLHELCHLQEHNHSKRFYALLNRGMPDWQMHKSRLDGMAELILNE